MHRRISLLAVSAALLLTTSGCGWLPWPRRRAEPPARNVLGINDDRFRELDEDALDAEVARPKNGLRLTIRTDKTAYQIGEPILVDVRLENVTSPAGGQTARDIPVYFEPLARAREGGAMEWLFKFQIRTEPAERLIYHSPEVKVPDTERGDYYHYVILPPQSFVGRRFVLWPSRARGLTNPGRYNIIAAYMVEEDSAYVIISRHLTAQQVELLGTKLAYVRVWTGQVFSNRVTIHVKRKKILGIF
ncbi:MAG TPA: hypothetical protein VNE39_11380 [Planctomycetota bacterium]|nr:hypothetical protein [Planctomycetota bacterium]